MDLDDKSKRQSFLGTGSNETLAAAKVAIVGLCGGGSHIAQQLAHVGVGNFVLIDFDRIDGTNLNRMVGATANDVDKELLKVDILADLVAKIHPPAKIQAFDKRWTEAHQELRNCSAVFGCVDSFIERERLEAYCRRYHVVYIDMGMDVLAVGKESSITGQVIASLPGEICMRCMGFITDDLLATEAQQYGAAGGKPQVVWPNGVLASTAVKIFMSLETPWRPSVQMTPYMEYSGDTGILQPSRKLDFLNDHICPHFNANYLGDAFWTISQLSLGPMHS